MRIMTTAAFLWLEFDRSRLSRLSPVMRAADTSSGRHGGLPGFPNFAPTAKRVIYLFQSGGPSQMELFDYKPRLKEFQGTDLPESIRGGQRLTGMSASQSSFPVVPSKFRVRATRAIGRVGQRTASAHGEDRRPLTFIKTVNTEEINHDPGGHHGADRFPARRTAQHGRLDLLWPRLRNGDLPAFVVMISPVGRGGQPCTTASGAAVFCQPLSRREVPVGGRSGPLLSNPQGFSSGKPPEFLDASGSSTRSKSDEFGRS